MNHARPMVGHLLAAVVFVDGPGVSFSASERTVALSGVYAATGILRRMAESWGLRQSVPVRSLCGFTVVNTRVALARQPASLASEPKTYETRDKLVLEDTMAQLGFSTGTLGDRYARMRQSFMALTFLGLPVDDAFPIIVSKYPSHRSRGGFSDFDAAIITWPDALANYRRTLDGLIAHEIGHVFDAPDEYEENEFPQRRCTVAQPAGIFDATNTNCFYESLTPIVLNPNQVPCVMNKATPNVCPTTPAHWGWRDGDGDGVLDVLAPATITGVSDRIASPRDRFWIGGNNVWDARVVAFGTALVTEPPYRAGKDEIAVIVPDGVFGIVNVSLFTRSGQATGSFDDTWVLVVSTPPPLAPPQPGVFAVIPSVGAPGDVVTILGTRMTPLKQVAFGGVAADLSLGGGTESRLEVPVPAGPTGTVAVTVTTSAATSPIFPPFAEFQL